MISNGQPVWLDLNVSKMFFTVVIIQLWLTNSIGLNSPIINFCSNKNMELVFYFSGHKFYYGLLIYGKFEKWKLKYRVNYLFKYVWCNKNLEPNKYFCAIYRKKSMK